MAAMLCSGLGHHYSDRFIGVLLIKAVKMVLTLLEHVIRFCSLTVCRNKAQQHVLLEQRKAIGIQTRPRYVTQLQ